MASVPINALRKFVITREPEERCDTCKSPLSDEHGHSFDPASRRVLCTCEECAALYASRFRPIPPEVTFLPDFQMNDAQWDDLMIPISLAFFCYNTSAQRMTALYPGPAGAAESLLRLDAWDDLCASNPQLSALLPDVQALLVNRVGSVREYVIVPIDECYRLVGLIRLHWRGLSGGAVVWGEIARFFERLRKKGENAGAHI
jgi:hypothetical protein